MQRLIIFAALFAQILARAKSITYTHIHTHEEIHSSMSVHLFNDKDEEVLQQYTK